MCAELDETSDQCRLRRQPAATVRSRVTRVDRKNGTGVERIEQVDDAHQVQPGDSDALRKPEVELGVPILEQHIWRHDVDRRRCIRAGGEIAAERGRDLLVGCDDGRVLGDARIMLYRGAGLHIERQVVNCTELDLRLRRP